MRRPSARNRRSPPGSRTRLVALAVAIAAIVRLMASGPAAAVTPHSPEVQKLVNAGLDFLSKNSDVNGDKLGGKCLIALAFLKADRRDHPRVQEAIAACRAGLSVSIEDPKLDVYSNGLAAIFLCELSPEKYATEIQGYLDRMRERQKPHGGWGYVDKDTGDTSQTQYSTLCYWEAHRQGFRIDTESVENVTQWLMRTQDPSGCWGYQGQLGPEGGSLVEQSDTTCSMLAAGLGSAYVCADLLDANSPYLNTAASEPAPSGKSSNGSSAGLPAALRPVAAQSGAGRPVQQLRPQRTDMKKLLAMIDRAHAWMQKNYEIDIGVKRYYYLYALERYKSFQEMFEGQLQDAPQWYNDGYEFLAKDQLEDGSWAGYCGPPCDTAFSVLFLLRSTQKSIRARLGEGTLLAGRGLPSNLSRAKLVHGQVVVDQVRTKVDELLSMIDDGNNGMLDELARDPSQLVVESVDEKSARRLQQLVRGGEPEVRLLAVRALGRTGNLDYVPTLLYALTDPDPRIVLEARDGLRFISRNFSGFGPPDDFDDPQRFEAVAAWKGWYRSIRPTAVLE